MTKTILAAAVASFALIGAANAATGPLVSQAQNLLNEYGFNVDARSLTSAEVVGLHFIDDLDSSSSAEIQAQIASVIEK